MAWASGAAGFAGAAEVCFGAPSRLTAGMGADSGFDIAPRLATDGQGAWIAVWTSTSDQGADGSDFDIMIARSADDGLSWTGPVAIDTVMPAGQDDFDGDPEIATDKLGRWMIVWSSFNPLAGTGADSDILFVRSSDNGLTWTAPAPLDPGAAADAVSDDIPQIETSGTGEWVAVWAKGNAAGRPSGTDLDVFAARSTNFGLTWTAPVWVNSNAAADSGDDILNAFATDGNGAWIVIWNSDDPAIGGSSDDNVLYSRSTNAGVSWSALTVMSPFSGGAPELTSDGAGR